MCKEPVTMHPYSLRTRSRIDQKKRNKKRSNRCVTSRASPRLFRASSKLRRIFLSFYLGKEIKRRRDPFQKIKDVQCLCVLPGTSTYSFTFPLSPYYVIFMTVTDVSKFCSSSKILPVGHVYNNAPIQFLILSIFFSAL